MPKAKKETVAEEKVVVEKSAPDSEAKKAYRAMIEEYKAQNPAKYETKRDELEAKLNKL